MGSPTYGLDVVVLAFAVVLAAAIVLLISHLCRFWRDAANAERRSRTIAARPGHPALTCGGTSAHARNRVFGRQEQLFGRQRSNVWLRATEPAPRAKRPTSVYTLGYR